MDVLSLFDGASMARVALNRANIKVNKYYSSEVDKYAIEVSNNNWPDIIRLGDVIKWREWDIDWSSIDLLIAGSPCQSWSVAGKQSGDEDERGKLLHVMVDIKEHLLKKNSNAKFILENVKLKKEFRDIFNGAIGVEPELIKSELVSAQRRHRNYWANFKITQPEDKNIKLESIIEDGVVDRDKAFCVDANYFKGGNIKSYFQKHRRQLVFNYSSSGRGNGVVEGRFTKSDKSLTLTATGYSNRAFTGKMVGVDCYRKLSPEECEKLQTLNRGYTKGVSNSQRYKMIGNGFTVDVIVHILNDMLKDIKEIK